MCMSVLTACASVYHVCVCLVSKEVVSLYLGPENQIWVPWNKKVPLTTKPTLQPRLGQTSISGKCSCLSRRIGQILSRDLTVNPTASAINSYACRLLSACCLQQCPIPGWRLYTTFSADVQLLFTICSVELVMSTCACMSGALDSCSGWASMSFLLLLSS